MEHSVPKIKRDSKPEGDPRTQRSRAGLRQALLDLLKIWPLDQITVRAIAAQAGVGYTTYFRHFPNRDALLEDLVAQEIEHLVRLTLPVYDARDRHAGCVALCEHVYAHRALWSVLLTGGAASVVRTELIRRGRETTETRPHSKGWLPGDLGVLLATSSMIELLTWWMEQPDVLTATEVAEILDKIAIAPVETAREQ